MKSDSPIDCAVFQLSPKRSRCELFVSSNGNTEKLASGLVKPFVAHLKVAEEQVASALQTIKLEVGGRRNAKSWFTKGTLERFVRFVSTPEVLELVNTYDAEMSQLEAARRIYSQGAGDQASGLGGGGSGVTAAADATKKELLRAIDVRLTAASQDLNTACTRAAAAGFNPDSVSELQMFADQFGANRLNDACSKFISLCQRRPDIIDAAWKSASDDRVVRSSYGSDMSIDEDPTTPETRPGPHPAGRDPPQPSTCQQPKPLSDSQKEVDSASQSTPPDQPDSAAQPSRRLSVKDRISQFESKQKESSGSGGAAKPVVGKSAELRRLSSDVLSAPPVLRRWSGASDMSIDLTGDKKEGESPLCTPTSASVPQTTKSEDRQGSNSDDTASSARQELGNVGGSSDQGRSQSGKEEAVVGLKKLTVSSGGSNSSLPALESDGWKKDQAYGKTQSSSSHITQFGNDTVKPQEEVATRARSISGGKGDGIGLQEERGLSGTKDRVVHEAGTDKSKDLGTQTRFQGFDSKSVHILPAGNQLPNQEETDSASQFRAEASQDTIADSGKLEGAVGSRTRQAFAPKYKGAEANLSASKPKWRSLESEEVEGKEQTSDETLSGSSILKVEDSGSLAMKFKKQAASAYQIKKSQDVKDEKNVGYGNNKGSFSGKLVTEAEEVLNSYSAPPSEQVQRVRHPKGSQNLNDELQMKANELEKLFAEHKLRVPSDQSNSKGRNRPLEVPSEPSSGLPHKKQDGDAAQVQVTENYTLPESSSFMGAFGSKFPAKTADNQNFEDVHNKSFADFNFSEGPHGQFYFKYMQIRDAKLREEWSSKRAEKEAKLKAMQDSFEQSRAEMKAKFFVSADKAGSVLSARQRAERLRSFNARSITRREQQCLNFGESDEDEDISELAEQKSYWQDKSFSEVSTGDDIARGSHSKKLTKGFTSTTPRISTTPVPRSSVKTSSSAPGKRRMQSENPLAQSVPNFSEMRKENAKPSFSASKTTRIQSKNFTRSKSTSEEPLVKEEKSHRSQPSRKTSGNPREPKAEAADFPVKSDYEADQSFNEKYPKNAESMPLFRKANGIDLHVRASLTTQKPPVTFETINNDEADDDLVFEPTELVDVTEVDKADITEEHTYLDGGEQRLSQESPKLVQSGSENDDAARSVPLVGSSLGAEFPNMKSSSFHSAEHLQDSPGESPVSWNSRTYHPFSYPREMSDVDATMDSPVGSPASWNSHSLSQTETDAARMRKKWGAAQKPMLAANSSHNHSRKDMTKGFKRLLKFGRKSRGTDSLVDWISATTSEGDDDMEDGYDPTNQSSEDLRKSRMGFPQGHLSDYSYSEQDIFNDQVQTLRSSIPAPPANFKLREDYLSGSSIKAPKSFFSLSTFRNKGSDSKLR